MVDTGAETVQSTEARNEVIHNSRMEKGMATHSSVLAWRIPWTEEPGGLQSMGSQSDTTLSDSHTHTHTHTHTQQELITAPG